MTPTALLVCMTIVTSVNHGSVVTRDCHYELSGVSDVSETIVRAVSPSAAPVVPQQAAPVASLKTASEVALKTSDVPVLSVKSQTTAMAKPRTARLNQKKFWVRKATNHYRPIKKRVKPVMTAEQNRAFRFSWFDRLFAQ